MGTSKSKRSGRQHTKGASQAPQGQSNAMQQGGQALVGNQAMQQQMRSSRGTQQCEPVQVRLPSPVAPDGALSYYRKRHDDFVSRYADLAKQHPECPQYRPPDYYLGYGDKYVNRFTLQTNPLLTPEGQKWLARARVNLQVAIESRRAADPAAFDQLEKDNDRFRSFAFGTHADAYWQAGLGDLSPFDLATIGLTPDVEDLLAWDGITQAADIGTRLLGHWGRQAIDYAAGEGTTEELVTFLYEGYSLVGDRIDEVFGEGTTTKLAQYAEAVGMNAKELAHGAYDYVAAAVEVGAEGVDSVFGEGTVSNAVNTVRRTAQSAVEYVEWGYNSAVEWASEVFDDIF